MGVAENKETVRRWFTEVIRGGIDEQAFRGAAAQLVSPRFVDHDGPDPEHGYEALLRAVPGLLHALPDARFTVGQLLGEGDLVAVRVRGEATHTGDLPGKPPTGKRISWTENEIFRLEGGKLAESWGEGGLDEALASIGLGFRAPQG